MFDPVLAGLLLPHVTERKAALETELAEFDSDVVCLAELWPKSTKTEVALAAKAAYPYQYSDAALSARRTIGVRAELHAVRGESPRPSSSVRGLRDVARRGQRARRASHATGRHGERPGLDSRASIESLRVSLEAPLHTLS